MKKLSLAFILFILLSLLANFAKAQRDVIYKKDSTQIRCKILKTTSKKYEYVFVDSSLKIYKTAILRTLVDSIKLNRYSSDLVIDRIFTPQKTDTLKQDTVSIEKHWKFNFSGGLSVSNILEVNNPSGTNKKSIAGNIAIDMGLNYKNDSNRFAITNELHYLFGLQKSGLTNGNHIQRVSDNVNTLHDVSVAIGKTKKWNFNLIAKTNTSFFTIYSGDYFKDVNNLGKIQGFLSPYDVTISPGFKWQPDDYLRISVSPYSFNLYGVKSKEIADLGLFITKTNGAGNYKQFLFTRLGAEFNIWYDRKIKNWLEVQYRLGISGNYFEDITKNGLLDGLFITKIRLVSDIYLTHRAVLTNDFSKKPFKPYYNQVILLSYAKSF